MKQDNENTEGYRFEQYRIYLASAEKISDRRDSANRYFLTINSALLFAMGVVFRYDPDDGVIIIIGLSLLGVFMNIIFWALINSYRQLNRAKFALIQEMEEHLPVQLYAKEWHSLGEGQDPGRYRPFSKVEGYVPIVFGVFHFISLAYYTCSYIKGGVGV